MNLATGIFAALAVIASFVLMKSSREERKGRSEKESDRVLLDRIVQEFRRRHPHITGVKVNVRDKIVRLSGPILADEVDKLLTFVQSLPGVARVEDHLQAHRAPDPTGKSYPQ